MYLPTTIFDSILRFRRVDGMKWLTPTRRGGIHCPTRLNAVNAARGGGPARDYLGIDVHKNESQICILREGGELVEQRIRTTCPGRKHHWHPSHAALTFDADVWTCRQRHLRAWLGE
jgi:hypothetical protein